MTIDQLMALFWFVTGTIAAAGVYGLFELIAWAKIRRQQAKKPWRKVPAPAPIPDPRRQRTAASAGKASVRKTKARIGGHRRLNR